MIYSDFTIETLKDNFGIETVEDCSLCLDGVFIGR